MTYDLNGHSTQSKRTGLVVQYRYDEAERLVEVLRNGDTVGSYRYDPLGRRIFKQSPQETLYFVYGEQGLLAELDSQGKSVRLYGWWPNTRWGTEPLFLLQGVGVTQSVFLQHEDQLGTAQLMTDRLARVVWTASSEAFGTTSVVESGAPSNPLRFAGQRFDVETGLAQNYFRDYDAQTGRYLQSDPIGLAGGVNTYAFGAANPLGNIDPLGLAACAGTCPPRTRKQCCQEAIASGGGPLGRDVGGFAGCCNGEPMYCLAGREFPLPKGWYVGVTPQVKAALQECNEKHEQQHKKVHVYCDERSCGGTGPHGWKPGWAPPFGYPYGKPNPTAECDAYEESVKCVKGVNPALCEGDAQCLNYIDGVLADHKRKKAKFCAEKQFTLPRR